MSGHSKWAKIKRSKGAVDQERGRLFQRIAKEIYVAVKNGDPNIDMNTSLKLVIEKAKGVNMPKDNIERAIEKAVGSAKDENFESIRYEGYGPSGVAFIVDCLTDNKNRTASMVRSAFTKRGGNLGTSGSVAYMFERIGLIVVPNDINEDEVMMCALDNGAIDFITNEDNYEIYTSTDDFMKVKEALVKLGVKEFLTTEVTLVANQKVALDEEHTQKALSLVELLEEIDDVQDVYHNLEE
ncbi:MAG: YebC/PmpR family DNA-binding transcriptional regulator [Bacilli bacterium]